MKSSRNQGTGQGVFFERQGFGKMLAAFIVMIFALAAIGFLQSMLWQNMFGSIQPSDFFGNAWMILFVMLVFFLPQWLALSACSYAALSFGVENQWWINGRCWNVLLTDLAFLVGGIALFWLWDALGAYVINALILAWGAIGTAALFFLYLRWQHARMHSIIGSGTVARRTETSMYVAGKTHCRCVRQSWLWIVGHWILGVVAVSLLSYLTGGALVFNIPSDLIVGGIVAGAVLACDAERLRMRAASSHA